MDYMCMHMRMCECVHICVHTAGHTVTDTLRKSTSSAVKN
jgi:hypothetical protein